MVVFEYRLPGKRGKNRNKRDYGVPPYPYLVSSDDNGRVRALRTDFMFTPWFWGGVPSYGEFVPNYERILDRDKKIKGY
jgi:hypothetical protein